MNPHPITRPATLRQLNILYSIKLHLKLHNRFPSTRTLQQTFGFKSQNAVICHLNALVRRKLLNHRKGGYSLPTSL